MGNGDGNTNRSGRRLGEAHGPREREEGKGGPEEPNKAYVGGPYVWTEGYLRWTRRSRGLEEDGTINDAIPQSLLARYGSLHREREIKALTGTKYTTVFFPSSKESVEGGNEGVAWPFSL
jgi:hypothetical protein